MYPNGGPKSEKLGNNPETAETILISEADRETFRSLLVQLTGIETWLLEKIRPTYKDLAFARQRRTNLPDFHEKITAEKKKLRGAHREILGTSTLPIIFSFQDSGLQQKFLSYCQKEGFDPQKLVAELESDILAETFNLGEWIIKIRTIKDKIAAFVAHTK